ncbi:RsmB/NOP family class I SAM-dependent RNA methyltransferase [Ferruginivarius sediminum]|uniref:RsmB/NOP family class I SAM-dependent RNA methyltransferase n=1 Tax=Ferruginivarius sediminum TaxID=2661937 RepID=A0A369TCC9_9PROT|nr:RsmB/NOP family class I SAM-dependent RNA methyltransferase [Ferruginivarius sediminum]RDD62482.1 RsmB/NOP family class I SAM-dependent RNA methyltransferase [Ferruginivarius sediminum]
MTPAARIEAAIDLLGQVVALDRPAEQVVGDYVRARRFMGSKDRRAVTDLVFRILRARARLEWWAAIAGGASREAAERAAAAGAAGPRPLVLAALVLFGDNSVEELARLCDGRQYHPQSLEPGERAMLEALAGAEPSDQRQPPWVRLEVPAWLLSEFESVFGEDVERELTALNAEAPVDLRVNRLLADDRDSVAAMLREDGIECEPTPLSPIGLRVKGRRPVTASQAFRQGLVEVQDEGSQLLALLVGARPDMSVCDLCAGAGGKTLALAGEMVDHGRLVALDTEGDRLGRAGPRLRRAGARNVERRLLTGEGDPWLREQAGGFDRVLVDAPCSGVGTWRRQPNARWRLSEDELQHYVAVQARILDDAAGLVRPGGRLIYATCSLLARENRERVWEFLSRHGIFESVAIEEVWGETVGGSCPGSGSDLTLSPARHGTDGFYVAVLQRHEAE